MPGGRGCAGQVPAAAGGVRSDSQRRDQWRACPPGCLFRADDLSYRDVDLADLRGHREVTDAYLAALAAHHDGLLATLDAALVQRHPHNTVLLGGEQSTVRTGFPVVPHRGAPVPNALIDRLREAEGE